MTRTIACVGKKLGCEKGFGVDMRSYDAYLFESLGPHWRRRRRPRASVSSWRRARGEEPSQACRIVGTPGAWVLAWVTQSHMS